MYISTGSGLPPPFLGGGGDGRMGRGELIYRICMYNVSFVLFISLNGDLRTCLYHPDSGSASCSYKISYCNKSWFVIVHH